jgi:hypothetical protein
MTESDTRSADRAVGLCRHCAYMRHVASARGSVFYLCTLSERDSHFAKYPRLPVLNCAGFAPEDVSRQP